MSSIQNQTRVVGKVCRIYKNSADIIIAMDDIFIIEESRHTRKNGLSLRTASRKHHRTLFHLGGDRVVASIQLFGNYSSLSDDHLTIIWSGDSITNDIEQTLVDLPQVGDTL